MIQSGAGESVAHRSSVPHTRADEIWGSVVRQNQVLVDVYVILKHSEGISCEQLSEKLVSPLIQAALREIKTGVAGQPQSRHVRRFVVLPSCTRR